MWLKNLRDIYDDFEQFSHYDQICNLADRLGYIHAEAAWACNPLVQGSTNPEDFKRVHCTRKEWHRQRAFEKMLQQANKAKLVSRKTLLRVAEGLMRYERESPFVILAVHIVNQNKKSPHEKRRNSRRIAEKRKTRANKA